MTMKEVAQQAGVSIATVSHVINGTKHITAQTKQRVLDAMRQVNYKPAAHARQIRQGRAHTIGVLAEDIRAMPVPGIVSGISETLQGSGYRMLFSDLHLQDKLYNRYEETGLHRERINLGIALLLRSQVDGIIYVGMHDRFLDGIIDRVDTPLVFAFSHGTDCSCVTYNNQEGAVAVVRHLVSLGHRRIALIAGHPHSYSTMQRLSGFQLAMRAAALPIHEGYIRYGDWSFDSGAREAEAIAALPNPPTAVFAMNDLMAAGCLRALLDMGKSVPGDMSVIGFDDREIAGCLTPGLTTMRLPMSEIGAESAGLLLRLITNPGTPAERRVLPCQMILRGSAEYRVVKNCGF